MSVLKKYLSWSNVSVFDWFCKAIAVDKILSSFDKLSSSSNENMDALKIDPLVVAHLTWLLFCINSMDFLAKVETSSKWWMFFFFKVEDVLVALNPLERPSSSLTTEFFEYLNLQFRRKKTVNSPISGTTKKKFSKSFAIICNSSRESMKQFVSGTRYFGCISMWTLTFTFLRISCDRKLNLLKIKFRNWIWPETCHDKFDPT